jgi:hypothetical protein
LSNKDLIEIQNGARRRRLNGSYFHTYMRARQLLFEWATRELRITMSSLLAAAAAAGRGI